MRGWSSLGVGAWGREGAGSSDPVSSAPSYSKRTQRFASTRGQLQSERSTTLGPISARSLSPYASARMYVRAKQIEDSDLDLFVTLPETPGLIEFVELNYYLEDTLGLSVDLGTSRGGCELFSA